MVLFDFPEFDTLKDAGIALDEMCEDAEEVQYTDKRGWKQNKYRKRINLFFDRFIAKCKRLSENRTDGWNALMKKAINTRKEMISIKDIVGELDKLY